VRWFKEEVTQLGRVFILAIDGLEHDLVVLWGLKNLMQKVYGKFAVSRSYYHKDENVPYTPIIWASFITSLPPEEHGVHSIFTYGRFLNVIRKMPIIKQIKGKRKILWRMGLKPRLVDKRDLAKETLFDRVTPSVAIDVPVYNEPTDVNVRLGQTLMSKGLREYVRGVWKVYDERKRRVFENLDGDWKLFMSYFKIADLLGHVYIAKRLKSLQEVYLTLDELANEIKGKIPDDTIFLVVSDHGMEPQPDGTGNHSSHAFYSVNIETNWRPSDIIDFYPKIMEWVV